MDDTIYRKDAVKKIAEHLGVPAEHWIGIAEEWIKDVPPAEPEQKKGMWERNPYSFTESYRCTRCGQKVLDDYWNYCPNCGADMRGEQDDDNGTD